MVLGSRNSRNYLNILNLDDNNDDSNFLVEQEPNQNSLYLGNARNKVQLTGCNDCGTCVQQCMGHGENYVVTTASSPVFVAQ